MKDENANNESTETPVTPTLDEGQDKKDGRAAAHSAAMSDDGLNEVAIHSSFQGAKPGDEFDLAEIGLSQDFKNKTGLKKETTSTPIRKPPKDGNFFAISPNPAHRLRVALITAGKSRTPWIVAKKVQPETARYWKEKLLVLCQTVDGDYFWWDIKMHNAKGDLDTWNTSALEIVEQQAGKYIQLHSNENLGLYEFSIAEKMDAPRWELDLEALIKKTLKGRVITSLDHEVLRRLRGEIA